MRIIMSPNGTIRDFRYPGQGLLDIREAGFDDVVYDLRLAFEEKEFRYLNKYRIIAKAEKRPFLFDEPSALEARVKAFSENIRKRKFEAKIMYAPCILRETRNTDCNEVYISLVKESLKLAIKEKCESVIVRPLFIGVPIEKEWKINREFYLSLLPIIKDTDIKILLQNQCKSNDGHLVRGIMSDPSDAIKWVDTLNEEAGENRFGFCLDLGACNYCGVDIYETMISLENRIDVIILSDNDGYTEECLIPFTSVSKDACTSDWMLIVRGLRKIKYDGPLIVDASSSLRAVSSLIRPEFMKLTKVTVDFLIDQIDLENRIKKYKRIVIFGAGNMGLNYITNYGEKYPPLYICDNNPNRWGDDFYGLTIHKPEDLLDLPKDYGIFICNNFHREIKEQLENMGVRAGIELFSDEFLSLRHTHYIRGI